MAETSSVVANIKTSDDEVQDIFKLLKSGDENIQLSRYKDIVLILGNTGAGKSTLTHFITGSGNDLISEEENEGEFIIRDMNNKVSNSTLLSKTLYPDRIVDPLTQTIFYDCPGFIDTRSPAHDISATYFVKKVIDFASRVKLVFVVNYHAVRKGVDRNDFLSLVCQASNLLSSIEKFKHSIALIVTKVDNIYKRRGRQHYLVPDKAVTASIVEFLKNAKDDINKISYSSSTTHKQRCYNSASKLIDILLQSDGDNYNRIGLFRRPDESGPLSDIQLLQEEKTHIKNIIDKNIIFSKKNEHDFGYSVSDQSLNYIYDLGEKINESVATELMKIGEEIKSYFEFEEKYTTDIYLLYDKFKSGLKLLSKLEMKGERKSGFLQDIIAGINDLDINISQDNILNITNYLSYLKFLNDVSKKSTANPLVWTQGLQDINKYLLSSHKWYNFLINLHSWLSEYNVQQNITEFSKEAIKLIKLYSVNESKTVHVSELNLSLILDKIKIVSQEHNIKNSYNEINDLIVNHERVKALKRVLNITVINNGIESSCEEPNKLVIKGHFIKLSDINWMKTCLNKVEYIELFATNKVFIDENVNKTGEILGMSIISPVWDVIGNRVIVLDGKPGDALPKASSGHYESERGSDGEPGLPGGAAGTFLGIAGEVNGGQLTVSAVGGRGGPGQEGGDGAPGKRGKDATTPSTSAVRPMFFSWGPNEEWDSKGVKWDYRRSKDEYILVARQYYEAEGTSATNGGNGGNGGIGGLGGSAGDINILDLKNSGKISVLIGKGTDGIEGKGGKGGNSAENGYNISADCEYIRPIILVITSCYNIKRTPAGSSMSGKPGWNGHNYLGRKSITDQVIEYVKPSHTINNFKNYFRKHLMNSINGIQLIAFQRNFENSERVKKLYDTLGLLNELHGLENDYHLLKENIFVLPFYESLLSRIHSYAMNPKEKERHLEHKKVLTYLYTATMSKLYCSGIKVKNHLILDIPKYLDIVVESIESLETLKNNDAINKHKQQYTNIIKNQICNVNDIMNKKAIPEIKNILEELDNKIHLLINDTLSSIQETEDRRDDVYKRQEKLEQSMFLKLLLYPINIVGDFLGFLNPAVEDIIYIINGVNLISEPLNLGAPNSDRSISGSLDQILHTSTTILEKILDSINDEGKGNIQLLVSQLHDVGIVLLKMLGLGANDNPIWKDTYEQVEDFKEKLNNALRNNEIVDEDTIKEMRNQVVTKLAPQNESLLISEKHDRELIDELKIISQVLNVTDISPELYENIRSDNKKLQLVGETLNNLNEKIKKLRAFEKNIYHIIIPKCKDLKKFLTDFKSKITGNSHSELQLHKWEIQTTIKDIKFEIEQVLKTFDLGEALTHCLDKLIEAMAYIINIYDLLNDYENQVNLASYIAHISSSTAHGIKLDNDELKEAVNELESIIKSNLLLEEYNRAMEAFIQYIFPFAHLYLDEYNLPPALGMNGTENLLPVAIEKVKRLRSDIVKSTISTNVFDEFIHKNTNFSNNHFSPFYVWEHSSNRMAITKLLNGAEIIIKSDIKKGIKKNAIKFNVIGINLKANNESVQTILNRDLENYEVKMKHFGNSHFKCGNKYYVMNSEPLTFKYHLRKNREGVPIDKNVVYEKVMTNDYQLSPYALWSIQLYNETSNYYSLRKYESEIIDIELVGRGQYIDNDEKNINICNKRIEEYYKVDEVESNLNSISDMINELALSAETHEYSREKRDALNPPVRSGTSRSINFSFINHFCTSVFVGLKALNYLNPLSHASNWIKRVSKGEENTNKFNHDCFLNNVLGYQEQTNSRHPNELMDVNSLLSSSNILLWDLIIRKYNRNTSKEFHSGKIYEAQGKKETNEYSHRMAYNYYAPPIIKNNDEQIDNPVIIHDSFVKSEKDIIQHISEQKPISCVSSSNLNYNNLLESQSLLPSEI